MLYLPNLANISCDVKSLKVSVGSMPLIQSYILRTPVRNPGLCFKRGFYHGMLDASAMRAFVTRPRRRSMKMFFPVSPPRACSAVLEAAHEKIGTEASHHILAQNLQALNLKTPEALKP